jgi:Zn-dependent protease
MLATVDFHDPLIWAILIGWIMSVILHEFAHGLAAYFGGDYTIRERGGLTLNPIQYIDPIYSILFPALIFVLGGVPLPGGATYIRRDLLRNNFWQVMVSAAGPLMNFLLFLALVLPFHPRIGWLDANQIIASGTPSNACIFIGAMAWLQMLSVIFNLIPIPPLDGFQMLAVFMKPQTRQQLLSPATRQLGFVLLFVACSAPGVFQHFHNAVANVLSLLGFDQITIGFFGSCYNRALFHVGS